MSTYTSSNRIQLVDALRGFAILAIMLLHNIEHFDFYYIPDFLPEWLKVLDSWIWNSLFFLFGGKAYGLFALLFGFTFYIQLNNQDKKQLSFGGRFLWRLFLLLLFGIFNSMFYEGDILTFYAILGVSLLPVSRLSDKAVFIVALILLLQPVEIARSVYYLFHPDYPAAIHLSDVYFNRIGGYLAGNSFVEMVKGNLTNGRLAVFYWSWENGRIFQTPGLFMIGMLLGRQGRFVPNEVNIRFWKKVLLFATVAFIPFFFLKENISSLLENKGLGSTLKVIITSWSNLSFMLVLVSSFVFLYAGNRFLRVLNPLSIFGRMSLTNYVMQSIVGSFIYYGYGFGLYQYTGATFSVLIGIFLFTLQLYFCKWWLGKHKQGPLEAIWRRATWI